MNESYAWLAKLGQQYGESFYLLDTERFRRNWAELTAAFARRYPKFALAYSYKTNYIPRLCQLVHELGGYAEVVSDMEYRIARHVGVPADRVIYNGPCKDADTLRELLLGGGAVNIDSLEDLRLALEVARAHPDAAIALGLRVSFDVGDGVRSRFGFDSEGDELRAALAAIAAQPNLRLTGLHCHFACRRLETWRPRAEGMLALIERLGLRPERVDLGGGLFGRMDESLRAQFDCPIPTYEEYAEAVGGVFAAHYQGVPEAERPLLLLEPGSALVGDCMRLAARVKSVKTVQGRAIATVLASGYNLHMGAKRPPIAVYAGPNGPGTDAEWDVAGYTCIEGDVLYRGYRGRLAVGDYVVFGNVGSYSIVFKPPFILPNFAVLEADANGNARLVKRAETFDDLFQTYVFD